MSDDRKTSRNIQKMKEALRTIRIERERVRALENLANILKSDNDPAGVKVTPSGRFRVWFRKSKMAQEPPTREFVLTDDERFEFMTWLLDQAWKRKKRADELEATLANGIATQEEQG